jgi:hypothetical protein
MNPDKVHTEKEGSGFAKARLIAMEKFLELHPRNEWPNWVTRCVNTSARIGKDRRWTVFLSVVRKEPLGPNERWTVINGKRRVVEKDPSTGEERVVISRAPLETTTIFEAVIDLETLHAEVVKDVPLPTISGDDLAEC